MNDQTRQLRQLSTLVDSTLCPQHVTRQTTIVRRLQEKDLGFQRHVGVSLDGEEGHASTSLDLAERQSEPVINLLPRPRRGVALGRR